MGSARLTILALVTLLALALLVWVAGNFLSGNGMAPEAVDAPPAELPLDPGPPPPVLDTPPPAPPPAQAETAPPAPPPVSAPVVPAAEVAAEPLPSLDESDAFVREELGGMERGAELLRYLAGDQILRRFVIFVDNVRVGSIPEQEVPFLRDLGQLRLRELSEDQFLMEVDSYARFTPLLDSLLAMDDRQAQVLYRSLYPLLQEAYAEIGYPRVDFSDTLLAAIDTVVSAELPEGPFLLTRPSVMYLFANEEIEGLNDVQKVLLRMGPENAQRLRDRLRQLRDSLQASRP